jgi:hypothetical protein
LYFPPATLACSKYESKVISVAVPTMKLKARAPNQSVKIRRISLNQEYFPHSRTSKPI